PYAPAVRAGDLVFCAGQIGIDPATGKLVPGGVAAETERACENLAAVLAGAGPAPADVGETPGYGVDLAGFRVVHERYGRDFPAPHPARATVQVAGLPGGARVEIEAIAARGR